MLLTSNFSFLTNGVEVSLYDDLLSRYRSRFRILNVVKNCAFGIGRRSVDLGSATGKRSDTSSVLDLDAQYSRFGTWRWIFKQNPLLFLTKFQRTRLRWFFDI